METTASLNYLWNQILALPASDRKWLRDKLDVYEEEEEHLAPYTMEELHARIERSRANIKAGRIHTTEEVRRMIESKHPWLCE